MAPSTTNNRRTSAAPLRSPTTTSYIAKNGPTAQQVEGSSGKDPVTSVTAPVPQQKNANQLSREKEKRAKLERRKKAIEAAKSPMPSPWLASTGATGAEQKRKRSVDDEEATEMPTKRNLTGNAATEIAQHREHSFSGDLNNPTATNAAPDVAGKPQATTAPPEQHLAPSRTPTTTNLSIPPGLEILPTDDEMTRMLKLELAKPCPILDDVKDDDEPEDPRIEQVLAPLTEQEKCALAKMCGGPDGQRRTTLQSLENGAKQILNARGKPGWAKMVAQHAPQVKKPSPLSNELVMEGKRAEEQEIDPAGRPKLAPKPKMRGPPLSSAAVAASASAAASAPSSMSPSTGNSATSTPASSAPSPASTAATSLASTVDYGAKTNAQLKELCKERNLPTSGAKAALMGRLEAYDDDIAMGKTPRGTKAAPKKERKRSVWDRLKKKGEGRM